MVGIAPEAREEVLPRHAPTLSATWHPHPDVAIRKVGDEVFLAAVDGTAIFHLNAMGAGLWNLLVEGVSKGDAETVIREAFPNVAADVIARDVDSLFRELASRGLIVPADHPADALSRTS